MVFKITDVSMWLLAILFISLQVALNAKMIRMSADIAFYEREIKKLEQDNVRLTVEISKVSSLEEIRKGAILRGYIHEKYFIFDTN